MDDRLKHVVSCVVFATITLFFHLTETLPSIHEDILERIKSLLYNLYAHTHAYIAPLSLSFLLSLSPSPSPPLSPSLSPPLSPSLLSSM